MRVSRSLTIKQMAMVAAVVMVFVFIFCTVLLFHLVQQNRYNTATQLESIARSVRGPLSDTILKGDIPEAETILRRIQPAGVGSLPTTSPSSSTKSTSGCRQRCRRAMRAWKSGKQSTQGARRSPASARHAARCQALGKQAQLAG